MSSTPPVLKRNIEPPPRIPLRGRTISLSEWWAFHVESKSTATPLLDLRSSEEYQNRRLCSPAGENSSKSAQIELTVVPIPISVVENRSFELPARHVSFSILVSRPDLDRADSFLCGSFRSRLNPWKVVHVLLDTEDLWSQAKEMGMICMEHNQEGNGQHQKRQRLDQEEESMATAERKRQFPLARLWQPDPMVETILFSLLVKTHYSPQQDHSNKLLSQVWDLGAGAGRDVAFLAENLVAVDKAYQIVAVDHRYNEKETKIVNDFFYRRGIRNRTTCIKLNLSQWRTLESAMASAFHAKKVAAIFCVRFWKAELVKSIAHSDLIFSGVLFGISHFCKPSRGAPWNFDHPSEKTVLERNQLSDLFRAQWDIIHDEIALDSDHGRTMIHFVARRR